MGFIQLFAGALLSFFVGIAGAAGTATPLVFRITEASDKGNA
ncbi:MAG: hypothetical protein ACOYNF_18460 [Rhodoferax sp.]